MSSEDSADASACAWEVVGPDSVPVTVRLEPALYRLLRWRRRVFTPPLLMDPIQSAIDYQLAPSFVQQRLLGGRWVVEVEADSGERVRVPGAARADALTYAQRILEGIKADGVGFLRTFAE